VFPGVSTYWDLISPGKKVRRKKGGGKAKELRGGEKKEHLCNYCQGFVEKGDTHEPVGGGPGNQIKKCWNVGGGKGEQRGNAKGVLDVGRGPDAKAPTKNGRKGVL